MSRLRQWLNLQRRDVPILGTLAMPFALAAAVAVMLASASKGLFLASNEISRLPLMFLGSALLTAIASVAYLSLIARTSLSGRNSVLLAGGAASLLLLRMFFRLQPQTASVVLLLWGPTVGHLTMVQTWNIATSTLPTRQAKRLVPVLAAITTAGAALGGGLVRPLLTWLSAEDLLYVVALLLGGALLHARTRLRGLLRGQHGASPDEPAMSVAPSEARSDRDQRLPGGALAKGLRSIFELPLLADLTLFVFLLQVASVVVDYQFSAELKPRYSKEGIAGFLGVFYMLSNLLVLVFTLRLTSRLVRRIGVGLALAASALVLGLGSAGYVMAMVSASLPGFWILAATVFAERVAQYGMTKPAMQLAYMPLNAEQGERAKTLIDGVVYRLATAVVSLLLIYAAPTLLTQFRLSVPVVLACAAAMYLGWRVTPSYRKALFDALRGQRLDPDLARDLRDNLGRRDLQELEDRLASRNPATVLRVLNMVRGFGLAVSPSRLNALLAHEDERVVVAALGCIEASGGVPDDAAVAAMLAPDRPVTLLRAVVQMLAATGDERWSEAVRPLVRHPDASVAAAACVLRIRAIGAVDRFAEEVAGDRLARATRRLTGMTRAGEFARALPELLNHPDPALRRNAIEQMGQLPLPVFIAPLIACLSKADARAQASAALLAHDERLLPVAAESLEEGELPLAARVALLRLCEQLGSEQAVSLLLQHTAATDHALRGQAIKALWRLTSNPDKVVLDVAVLRSRALAELALLTCYAKLAAQLKGGLSARRGFVAQELRARRERCERRALRLLGMIKARPAVNRVLLNYRSPRRRVRSNAFELLEQHLNDPELLPLVTMMERSAEGTGGGTSQLAARTERVDAEALLADDPWLLRLWQWVERREPDPKDSPEIRWADRNDRMVYAKQAPMFGEVSGEQWIQLAEALERKRYKAGDVIVAQGDDAEAVYWIMSGTVSVLVNGSLLQRLEAYQCFGEMAVLEGAPRSARIEAQTDVTLITLNTATFYDTIELQPAFQRRLVRALVSRLRTTISGAGKAAPNSGAADSRVSDTGTSEIGVKDNGAKDTGATAAGAGASGAGASDTDLKDAGAKDAGADDAGANDADAIDSGAKDRRSHT